MDHTRKGNPLHFALSWMIVVTILLALGKTALARPNILFIAIDDLRNDLGAAGVTHARTPHLDQFAASGRYFVRHYAQVPTCGASRAALLRGRYPERAVHLGNDAIRQSHADWAASLPGWLQKHGYTTFALGKITHYPGGRTGRLWSEGPEELPGVWNRSWIPKTPWGAAQHIMHGYANGQPRVSGKSPALEAMDGPDSAYPDAWIAEEAIETLRTLANSKRPWFFAVGFFKPHLPFAAPKRFFDLHDSARIQKPVSTTQPNQPSGWHRSGEFRGNYGHGGRDPETDLEYAAELRHAYAASISYVDAQVGRTLEALKALGLSDDTIVVVWGDHGFLLGEHAIWGKHCLYEEALRSPLIIRSPGMKHAGKPSLAVVESVDIFPTLVDLTDLPAPAQLSGRSLRAQIDDPSVPSGKAAHGFWTDGQRTIRTERWRLISHPKKEKDSSPGAELFDFSNDSAETTNVATDHPLVVRSLLNQLEKLPATE